MAKLNTDAPGVFFNDIAVPVKQATTTIDFGGFTRTVQLGPGGRVLGYANQTAAGTFSCTVAWQAGEDVRALYDFEGGEIKIVTDQGDTLVGSEAALVTTPNWSAGEGDMTLEYNCSAWVKL